MQTILYLIRLFRLWLPCKLPVARLRERGRKNKTGRFELNYVVDSVTLHAAVKYKYALFSFSIHKNVRRSDRNWVYHVCL